MSGTVPQPVVLLDIAWSYRNTPLVRGDIFELSNPEIASIREYQEHQVGFVNESSLTPKSSYWAGIVRSPAGAQTPPTFVSAEVGSIAADRLVMTFAGNTGMPSAKGWTIEVDSNPAIVLRTVSQGNTTVTFYLETPVTAGQIVTAEYDGTGDAYNPDDGALMGALVQQSVTNNVL